MNPLMLAVEVVALFAQGRMEQYYEKLDELKSVDADDWQGWLREAGMPVAMTRRVEELLDADEFTAAADVLRRALHVFGSCVHRLDEELGLSSRLGVAVAA